MNTCSRRNWLKAAGAGLLAGLARSLPAQEDDPMEPDDDMIVIPAGPFLMGTREEDARRLARDAGYHPSWLSGEWPQREVVLPAYAIDRYPVTNRQYRVFCQATGYPSPSHWRDGEPPAGLLDHPVTSVNRADARAYARWAGKRLPTEAEWEKAARGTDGRLFPWGDQFDPEACCWNRDPGGAWLGTEPVTAHPRGASPYRVMDMVGNVAEWCDDSPGPGAAYIKGGCWMTSQIINLRPAARTMSGFDNNPLPFYGFRCAKEVE